jgi:hypothetical protein
MKKALLAILIVLCIPVFAYAKEGDIVFWDGRAEIFENDNTCVLDNTCDLKAAWIVTRKYKVIVEGIPSFGTVLRAGYMTGSADVLEKYGFVQFIRGCMFSSTVKPDGSVVKSQDVSKWQFGEIVPFSFPEWVIDSDIKDPLYMSRPGYSRTFYAIWLDNGVKTIYGRKKPAAPALFLEDHPGTAYILGTVAHNISNEFRICIYKVKDVPVETTQENIHFAKPIHCFTWNSIVVYDHAKEIFEMKEERDPFCRASTEEKK